MKKIIYNDYELLYLINRRSSIAHEMLLEKYRSLIIYKLSKYYLSYSKKEDFIQECMYEIAKSIPKYNVHLNILFVTYVNVILDRKIPRLMKKHCDEVKYVQYMEKDILEVLQEEKVTYNTPFEQLLASELHNSLYAELKGIEKDVYKDIMLKKMSIECFSKKYNVDVKKVYNVIHTIKKKCSLIINNN